MYILNLLNTNTHTSIKPLPIETETYVGNTDTLEGACTLSSVPLFLTLSPLPALSLVFPLLVSLSTQLPALSTSYRIVSSPPQLQLSPALSSSLFSLSGPIGGVGSVWQAACQAMGTWA